MFERDGICRVPALCRTCRRVVVVNLFDPADRSCPDCGNRVFLYTDPKQQTQPPERDIDGDCAFWWGALPTRSAAYCLTRASCTCPQCGRLLLRFVVTARKL